MKKLLQFTSRSIELMKCYRIRTSDRSTTSKAWMVSKDLKGTQLHRMIYIFVFRGGDNRQKGPNAKAEVWVSLEELYSGTTRDMTI